jgi:pimeloyl-ACP methyl ester carboxylesterase
MATDPGVDPVQAWTPDAALSPPPDQTAEPEGFLVAAGEDVRVHFLEWRGTLTAAAAAPGVLLLPGFLAPAWSWTPVARRLAGWRRTVVADLRGQGLSDAPFDGYGVPSLAADAVAVAEGSGLLDAGPVVLAGHGFGAAVAAVAASLLGDRCAGLVLVDGGWERLEETTGADVDDFLRGLDEPPEVLRSMAAYLGDRRGFDPGTWDADQEQAARDAVVETAAGHVVRAVRPHVVEAIARAMFEFEPAEALAAVAAPVSVLVALGSGDAALRVGELRRSASARTRAGLPPLRGATFPEGHNLPRYRPAELTAAILAAHEGGAS